MNSDNSTQEPILQVNHPDEAPALPARFEVENAPHEYAAREYAPRTNAPRDDSQPSGAKTAWRVVVFLFKLGLFLALLAALAAAIYFGWPKVYTQYILPVQANTARLAVLEESQQAGQAQLFAMQTQLPTLATAQAGQTVQLTAQAGQVAALAASLDAQAQAAATTQAGQEAALAALAPRMKTLESAIQGQAQVVATLQNAQTSLQAEDASARTELEQQVILLKSMELLSRARLFLYQSNYGLAEQDIQTARDLLAGVLASPNPPLDDSLADIVQRLDQALARLPEFPVAANDDLNIAWQILLGGQAPALATPVPPAATEAAPSPTQTGTPGLTPTTTAP